jgi:hypothetical protein
MAEERLMPSGAEIVCPYHDHKEVISGVPYLLECGCKCMQAFDRRADADQAAEVEGGQVAEWKLENNDKFVVIIYIPTAIPTP